MNMNEPTRYALIDTPEGKAIGVSPEYGEYVTYEAYKTLLGQLQAQCDDTVRLCLRRATPQQFKALFDLTNENL
jgi:hypothetical protein